MREYFFASGLLRYAKRKAFLPSEWRKKLKKAPSLLGLNVTDVCNARCVYCAYRFHKPEGVMDMATYETAICEFAGMGGGVRWVYPI